MKRITDPIGHFWSKVDKGRGPDACWPWLAGRMKRGYGAFAVLGKPISAHRFSWMATHGPIPDGRFVCHRCDNPICVNPTHLFAGTAADNNADMMRKGRNRWAVGDLAALRKHPELVRRGEGAPQSKLTEAMVREIRAMADGGWCQRRIAELFGVSYGQTCRIISGKAWAHVPRIERNAAAVDAKVAAVLAAVNHG